MAKLHQSPLHERHAAAAQAALATATADAQSQRPGAATGSVVETPQVEYLPWNPGDSDDAWAVAATYGSVELEYAALRRGAGVVDQNSRGTLIMTGEDRRAFLNNMVTQELKDLDEGVARESFWLNRKGRIEADLLLTELGDRIIIDVDRSVAAATVESLNSFVFTEEATIEDASDAFYHLSLHGIAAHAILAIASSSATFEFDNLHATSIAIAGVETIVIRRDQIGTPGFELIVSRDDVDKVWDALLAVDDQATQDDEVVRVRPVGWYAFNIARIEAGTPLMHVDYGSENLPHETGVLRDRVSFTKGCYLGQEIVARMESLGKPKQTLIGFKVASDNLPSAGDQVFATPKDDDGAIGDPIGTVTSSTLSPMRGTEPIGFAMIRTKHATVGNTVKVAAEGEIVDAELTPLRFWPEQKAVES